MNQAGGLLFAQKLISPTWGQDKSTPLNQRTKSNRLWSNIPRPNPSPFYLLSKMITSQSFHPTSRLQFYNCPK